MATQFPDPSASPWTNPETGVTFIWTDPPGSWVAEGEESEYVLKAGDTMEGSLKLPSQHPVDQEEASNKDYVDTKTSDLAFQPDIGNLDPQPGTFDDRYVNVGGDSMQGSLTMSQDPVLDLEVATKQYVDNNLGAFAQSLITVEEQIEIISPSRERGLYTYSDSAVSLNGEFHLNLNSYSASSVFNVSQTDNDGTVHGYGDVVVGDQVEILEVSTPNGLLGTVTTAPVISNGVVTIEFTTDRSLGNPVEGNIASLRIFKVSETDYNLQELEAKFVRKDTLAGDTMIGPLALPGDPVSGNQAATKDYVDSKMPLDIRVLPLLS
jgi:hypothetical protein